MDSGSFSLSPQLQDWFVSRHVDFHRTAHAGSAFVEVEPGPGAAVNKIVSCSQVRIELVFENRPRQVVPVENGRIKPLISGENSTRRFFVELGVSPADLD